MSLTLADRIAAFEHAYPKWRASWPRLVREQNRDVLYATWLIGNDYRNASKFYGSYPPGFLARVLALFPDVAEARLPRSILHAFSGSLPPGEWIRLDLRRSCRPDVVGNVYDAKTALRPHVKANGAFRLVLADPPYSAADAAKYETPTVDRRRALAGLAEVTRVGGHLVWLDTVWPMHRKVEWVTVGRIAIVRSTNHRIRMATIFERCAA